MQKNKKWIKMNIYEYFTLCAHENKRKEYSKEGEPYSSNTQIFTWLIFPQKADFIHIESNENGTSVWISEKS